MCAVQDSFKHWTGAPENRLSYPLMSGMEKGDRQLRVERSLPIRSSRNQDRKLGLAQHCARDPSEDPLA